MKQTAVEWLAEQYNLVGTAEYEQAKEMERQQIMEAYDKISMNTAEQYYNETFI
jgi:hypothetical protein